MKVSARNALPGMIRKIERGAVIKASSVMIGVD
jgi:molybdopterin-binding protein